jgi:hypothetical protein
LGGNVLGFGSWLAILDKLASSFHSSFDDFASKAARQCRVTSKLATPFCAGTYNCCGKRCWIGNDRLAIATDIGRHWRRLIAQKGQRVIKLLIERVAGHALRARR